MQKAAKAQRTHNTKFKVLVSKKQKSCLNKYLKKNDSYYKKLLTLIKSIDSTALQCNQCELSTENASILADYEKYVREMYKLSDSLKSCFPKRKSVPCTRSRTACSKPYNYNLQRQLKRYARTLRDQNLKKTRGIPKETCRS